jgi:hypothetical protein
MPKCPIRDPDASEHSRFSITGTAALWHDVSSQQRTATGAHPIRMHALRSLPVPQRSDHSSDPVTGRWNTFIQTVKKNIFDTTVGNMRRTPLPVVTESRPELIRRSPSVLATPEARPAVQDPSRAVTILRVAGIESDGGEGRTSAVLIDDVAHEL